MLIAADKQLSLLEAQQFPDAVFQGKLALDPCVSLQRSKALMLMTQDETASSEPITPERVIAMAEYLGIVLDRADATHDAEPEFCFLWIAVEALRAPMPPLWHRTPDSLFKHAVTHQTSAEHPMLPVYREHVAHERLRKKSHRPFQALERFMLFANGDGDGESAFTWFNFATRQALGGRKLPAEAVAEQVARRPPPPPPKKMATRATAASMQMQSEKRAAQKANKADKSPVASLPRPKALTKEQQASLRAQASVVRKSALALRPRTLPEVMVAARMLNVDLVANPTMLWVVDLCLACDYLPVGWSPVRREKMVEMPKAAADSGIGHLLSGGVAMDDGSDAMKADSAPSVTWLPPLERLWHIATTGQPPPQYIHRMCALTTERHPLSGFVRMVLGLEPA